VLVPFVSHSGFYRAGDPGDMSWPGLSKKEVLRSHAGTLMVLTVLVHSCMVLLMVWYTQGTDDALVNVWY